MATGAGDDWAELGDELAYKALDTLQDRVWEYSLGLITGDAVIAVCKSLMDSVSGLVPWSCFHLIYTVRKVIEREEGHPQPRRQSRL